MLLAKYKIQADIANSGDRGISLVEKRIKSNFCCPKYKVIFMDIDMPGKNGYETSLIIN